MFVNTKGDGLMFVSDCGRKYELLEGICSSGLTSDIIFILDRNNLEDQKIVNFIYGGFDNLQKDGIKNYIRDYEKENNFIK